jgi:hypothetical protein
LVKIPETTGFLKKELIDFEMEHPVNEMGEDENDM